MALEQELETYNKMLPELLKYEGDYVTISGTRVINVTKSYSDALQAGYDACKLQAPFFVRRILKVQPKVFFRPTLIS